MLGNSSIELKAILQQLSSSDLGVAQFPLSYDSQFSFTDGSGANQAGKIFSDTRTLAASATESLDFSGVLLDPFGAVITSAKLKALIIKAAAANTNDVLVGGAASNALSSLFGDATDIIVVKPGGLFCVVAPQAAGYAITAGTGDLLKVANSSSGTGVTYDIIALFV